jgi:hypothetical protein
MQRCAEKKYKFHDNFKKKTPPDHIKCKNILACLGLHSTLPFIPPAHIYFLTKTISNMRMQFFAAALLLLGACRKEIFHNTRYSKSNSAASNRHDWLQLQRDALIKQESRNGVQSLISNLQ